MLTFFVDSEAQSALIACTNHLRLLSSRPHMAHLARPCLCAACSISIEERSALLDFQDATAAPAWSKPWDATKDPASWHSVSTSDGSVTCVNDFPTCVACLLGCASVPIEGLFRNPRRPVTKNPALRLEPAHHEAAHDRFLSVLVSQPYPCIGYIVRSFPHL